ncbi:unnamed protein product, partial [Prorocentrum cordatum]
MLAPASGPPAISVTGPQTEADKNVKRLGNPENKALTAAIKKAARQRDWDGAATLFAEAKAPDALLYSALFHAADLCGRPGEAFARYEDVRRLGLPRNWVMITPLIKLAGRQGDLDRARGLVEEMREAGHRPDEFVCAVLVEAHKRVRDVRGALQVYTDMREEGILVSALLLSAVMSAVASGGDVTQTEALLQDARGQFEPNVVHFNCVLQACKRAGDADAALRVLRQDMPRAGAKPDTISYTSVLAALRRAGRPPADVDGVVGEMRAAGVPPDDVFLEEQLACILPPGAQERHRAGSLVYPSLEADALESAPRSTLEALASAIRNAREAGIEPGAAAADLEARLAASLGAGEDAGATADWVRVVAAGEGGAGAPPRSTTGTAPRAGRSGSRPRGRSQGPCSPAAPGRRRGAPLRGSGTPAWRARRKSSRAEAVGSSRALGLTL